MPRRQAKRGRESDAQSAPVTGRRGDWESTPLENPKHERFYRGAVVPEAEWTACFEAFKAPLPTCFRLNTANVALQAELDATVRSVLSEAMGLQPVVFVPGAYQSAVSRSELKRGDAMVAAKRAVNALAEHGALSRQEAVSMIPPLLLDVRRGQRVLDMCAAPGSKTTQCIEALLRADASAAAAGGDDAGGGVVVANDVHHGRLDVLARQVGRIPAARARLIVTQHDATQFPLVRDAAHKFDRVLCDVMCSGDGTLRKSRDLWARWSPRLGPALHASQCKVLRRGMSMVRAGGRVVYSTCSLHPAEDEAVVAECLVNNTSGGEFELVDAAAELAPALVKYAGLSQWRLMDDAAEQSFETPAAAEGAPDAKLLAPSMWAPADAEARARLHLDRCVRVAPHQQDTGGFFIAVLRCVKEPTGSVGGGTGKYAPTFEPINAAEVADLRAAFGLTESDGFPFDRCFVMKGASRQPKVYYAAPDTAATAGALNAKVIGMGVKIFNSHERELSCARFTSEGAAVLEPLLPRRLVRAVEPGPLLAALLAGLREVVMSKGKAGGKAAPAADAAASASVSPAPPAEQQPEEAGAESPVAPAASAAPSEYEAAVTAAVAKPVSVTAPLAAVGWPAGESPKDRHYMIKAALPRGVGEVVLSAERSVGAEGGWALKIRVLPHQWDCLRLALGMPLAASLADCMSCSS